MTFVWINFANAAMVGVLLICSLLGQKKRDLPAMKSRHTLLNIAEQVGRYACMLLMILPLRKGLIFNFASIGAMLVWAALSLFVLACYVLLWTDEEPSGAVLYGLALLPMLLFLIGGRFLRHPALTVAAVLFGFCHTLITREYLHDTQNNEKGEPH